MLISKLGGVSVKQLSSPHSGREAGQPGVQGQCWLHSKFKASLGCLRQCLKGRKTKGALILFFFFFGPDSCNLCFFKLDEEASREEEKNYIPYCPIVCIFLSWHLFIFLVRFLLLW